DGHLWPYAGVRWHSARFVSRTSLSKWVAATSTTSARCNRAALVRQMGRGSLRSGVLPAGRYQGAGGLEGPREGEQSHRGLAENMVGRVIDSTWSGCRTPLEGAWTAG